MLSPLLIYPPPLSLNAFPSSNLSTSSKSQCFPPSFPLSPLTCHSLYSPFLISYLFLNQNMAQKDPLKNIPSTAANATSLSANLFSDPIHRRAQSAFAFTAGISVWALNSFLFVALSLIKVSISKLYISCNMMTRKRRGIEDFRKRWCGGDVTFISI